MKTMAFCDFCNKTLGFLAIHVKDEKLCPDWNLICEGCCNEFED